MSRKILLYSFFVIEAIYLGITSWAIATHAVNPYGGVYVYFFWPFINIATVGVFFIGYFSGKSTIAKIIAPLMYGIYFFVNIFFDYALLHDVVF